MMCSSTFGPASAPSFVTCPTMKKVMPRLLAMRCSFPAHSRTCPTLPAAEESALVYTAWMESMTTTVSSVIASSMSSRQVSFRSSMELPPSPSRAQRSLTCEQLSSAETYSTFCVLERCAATSVRSVLLPMPGSPPTSTREPGTMPPPSTTSSSEMPEGMRAKRSSRTSFRGTGRAKLPERSRFAAFCGAGDSAISSTSVPNLPQPGHLPSHCGLCAPHSEQTYTLLLFAIVVLFGGGMSINFRRNCFGGMATARPVPFVSSYRGV